MSTINALLRFLACLLFASSLIAAPTHNEDKSNGEEARCECQRKSHVPLRILPLGNSITWGYLSSDGNGYRLDLLNKLTANGTSVQYIGSQRSGNMTNNANEGHPGALINEIAQYAFASLPQQPNVILLMAGTNDMNDDNETATAPHRLSTLIEECHNATNTVAGSSVILVAQLTPAADNATESRIKTFNKAVPGLVATKVATGIKVLTVDMSKYVTVNDLKDGLHPNDYGYAQMAKAWYAGIEKARRGGWITPPISTLRP